MTNSKGQGIGSPYSYTSVGHGADDPDHRQSARRWQSHIPSGRLPLLSARPAVIFPAREHHRHLADRYQIILLGDRGTCVTNSSLTANKHSALSDLMLLPWWEERNPGHLACKASSCFNNSTMLGRVV